MTIGKTVFITGAASGIGLATARRFAGEGWFVGLYDINSAKVESLSSSHEFKASCAGYCDVGDRDSVRQALEHFLAEAGGRMDLLVNNAGVLSAGKFESIKHEDHEAIIRVNVLGLTNVSQLAFPALRDTPGSTLLNLCSVSSVHGVPLLAAYSASKFYVNGLTQALSIEWAEHGINVKSVKPAFVSTEMIDGMPEQLMSSMTVDFTPEQIADAIWNVHSSPRSSHLLGWKARAFGVLAKILPAALGRRLVMHMTGY